MLSRTDQLIELINEIENINDTVKISYLANIHEMLVDATTSNSKCIPPGIPPLINTLASFLSSPTNQMIERLKDEISDIEFQPNNIVNYSKNLSLYVYYIRSKSPSTSRNWQQIVEQYPSDSSMLALLDSGATEAEIINDLELFDDQFKEGCNLYASERVLAAFPAPSCSENERLNKNLQKIVGPLLGLEIHLGFTSPKVKPHSEKLSKKQRQNFSRS